MFRSAQSLAVLARQGHVEDEQPKGPAYCRPLRAELEQIQEQFPLAKQMPMDSKRVKAFTRASMAAEWHASKATAHARAWKPCVDACRYLAVDGRPVVCIRARLRLNVALTPKRRHLYGLLPSPLCVHCHNGMGDASHILLTCPKFASERARCVARLQRLSYPVELTLRVCLGECPPSPEIFAKERTFARLRHDDCLQITGDFLRAVDTLIHL